MRFEDLLLGRDPVGEHAVSTPLVDAAVAIVPGLVGMSRSGDNAEVLRLRRGVIPVAKYHAVVSDFEPEEVGWHFWRYFTRTPLQRVADLGADYLFDGANDLVVDTESMRDLRDNDGTSAADIEHFHAFPPSARVHHLNYFEQQETLDLIQSAFRLDGA